MFYEPGDRFQPRLLSDIRGYFAFYASIITEDAYKELKSESVSTQFQFLADNIRFVMRDCDWEKIYDSLCTNHDAFARYYPAARVKVEQEAARCAVRAIVCNDELYTFLRSACVETKQKEQA